MPEFNSTFTIGKDEVGEGKPVYLVAEMSANHGQDYSRAVDIIYAAKEAGANAVKLQTYTPDTITLNCNRKEFYINSGPWKGQTLYDLYQKAMMPWEWHEDLKALGEQIDITVFSAPFDSSAVKLLQKLKFPAIKIASPEIIDLDLIAESAQIGVPVIISTGMATFEEIEQATQQVALAGNANVCLLKCTSEYPAPANKMHLKTIQHLRKVFQCPVGLSDHSEGISVPIAAVALGAAMIEKHFVLSKADKTVDSFFSLTAREFTHMVEAVREVEDALGEVHYEEEPNRNRRALFAVKEIESGEILSQNSVRSLRPGGGIEPRFLKELVGRKSRRKISLGEPMKWDMIE